MIEDIQLKEEGLLHVKKEEGCHLKEEEGEVEGIPEQHLPAIWEALATTREAIMEATGLELAVEAYIERIRTSHRRKEYVRH